MTHACTTRLAAVATASAALVVAAALPASAHVTVTSPDASPGGFGKLVFRVPSESESASTTKLTVTLPASTPFAFVSTKPVPGWQVSTTERTLATPLKTEGFTLTKAVDTVTWTATGRGLGPGQFDEFELSVGPFPRTSAKLRLPATQTYSDGSVVRWDQATPRSGEEPEHPAPTLAVATAKAPAREHAGADAVARWLGGGGLALGLAALGVAVASSRRHRKAAP